MSVTKNNKWLQEIIDFLSAIFVILISCEKSEKVLIINDMN